MLQVPANLSGLINGRFEQGLTGPLTATIGREAAINLADERKSAKHQLRPDTGLSDSSNKADIRATQGIQHAFSICARRSPISA